MINVDTKAELEDLHLDCMTNTQSMARTFFPHSFSRPFSKDHYKVFNLLDDDTKRLLAMALPRGYGKTTTVGKPFVARKVLYRDVRYVLYISCTSKKAIRDVKNLATELTTNQDIIKAFGNIQGDKWAENSGELETSTGILIEGLGAGSQIRGRLYNDQRPDLIIIDDLEDPEAVRSDDRRGYLKEWFFSDLLGAIDLKTTRVVVIGTILADNSLLADLLSEATDVSEDDEEPVELTLAERSELFTTLRLEAFDDNLKSNWPEYMTDEQVAAKYKAYERRGLLDVLFREYRNLPIAAATALFKRDNFKYYKAEDDGKLTRVCENLVIVDPAKTLQLTSAYTAVVGWGFDSQHNRLYFRDCVNRRMSPDDTYKEAADMADRIGARVIAVKVTSLNMYISYPFKTYLATRKRYYEFVEIKERGDKDERIGALAPFYNIGCVYHNDSLQVRGAYETQLLRHPKGKYKDVADAAADIVPLLDLGERFFTRQLEEEESKESIEAEYKELEKVSEPLPKGFFLAV